jgi:pimeloyl-ACP methyl ester carboxylesterase
MRARYPDSDGLVVRDGVEIRYYAEGEALADCTGGPLVTLAGAGHFPHVRDPVRVNLLIRQFANGIRR